MNMVAKIGIAAVVVLVLAGGAYWWAELRDTSAPSANLDAMAVSTDSQVPGSQAPGSQASGSQAPGSGARPDGTWTLQDGADVFVGYRVNETALPTHSVHTVNGRSAAVTGTLTITDGSVTTTGFTVDLTKLDSGTPLREQVLQSVGLETGTYPQATFALREPVVVPAGLTAGTQVSLTLKGTMTAHGVTHDLDVPVQAKWDGTTIVVATVGDGAPFVMADWGVTLPRLPISDDDDHGTIEAQLRFVKQ
jgi:hypothetical protein